MYAYCFFCQTNKCSQIVALLKKEAYILDAISPKVVKRLRKKGTNIESQYDLLPGYIFVYSTFDIFDSLDGIKRRDGVICCLGNPENNFTLSGYDFIFANNIYKKNGVIQNISLQKSCDIVKILDPMFLQMNAEVSKIDYRKGRARIEYEFAGRKCYTWAAVEIIM